MEEERVEVTVEKVQYGEDDLSSSAVDSSVEGFPSEVEGSSTCLNVTSGGGAGVLILVTVLVLLLMITVVSITLAILHRHLHPLLLHRHLFPLLRLTMSWSQKNQ